MTIQERNEITDKGKLKPDGVYQYKGLAYRVVKGKVTHIAESGQIYLCYGFFNAVVGACGRSVSEGKKALQVYK